MAALFIGAALLAACATDAPQWTPGMTRIAISAVSPERWVAAYVLPAPATELVFARQPDDSRTRDWTPAPGFELVRVDGLERLRRTDGAPFVETFAAMKPAYRDLPMDYAPFSPFGDGGMLMYSGRFHACAATCADDARWQMMLDAPGQTILVDGQRHDSRAMWTDSGSGRNVYVGETAPVQTPDFLAVIDTALPDSIRTQLATELPGFMKVFAERLGALPERPMLFASYDIRDNGGSGRQGGTLPGQVFVHFYGPIWPQRMVQPGFAEDLAWHFAHEGGHLYQDQIYINGEGAWVHEGGAEAFAALALRLQGQAAAADAQVAASAQECSEKLRGRSIRAALADGEYRVAYACGLQVNLAIDAAVRKSAPQADGLFSVWSAYRRRVAGKTPSEEDFHASVSEVGGEPLAAQVRAMIEAPAPDFTVR